jgi:hypothetical protein
MRRSVVVLSLIASGLLVAACGGGGGDSAVARSPVINGLVATGSAVAGAAVKAFDSTGAEIGSGTTGSDGGFAVTLSKTGKAPYVLFAEKDEIRLAAIFATAQDGTVNVTPISDAAVTLLYPQGSDVLSLLKAGTSAPTEAEIAAKQDMLRAALQPLLLAAGATTTDPFTSTFKADGTGFDKVLDSVSVSKFLADGGTARVELGFKVATDPINATSDNPTVTVSNTSSLNEITSQVAGVSISGTDLPPNDAGSLYQDFIDRANACYREPVATRTDRESMVLSQVCRDLFVDSDPSKYLHAGFTVKRGGQFSGLFTYGGSVEFKALPRAYLVQDLAGAKSTDGKGRAIIATSWVNTDGNRENISLYVTKYSLNGKEILGLSGDQNQYGFFVNSHNQKREFPLRTSSDLDYVQGNWLIVVRDVNEGNSGVIDFVRVNSPGNKEIIMAPARGGAERDLRICKLGEVTVSGGRKIPSLTADGKKYCTGVKSITVTERFINRPASELPSETITNAGIIRPLKQEADGTLAPYTPGDQEVGSWRSTGLWTAEYHFRDSRTPVVQKTWSVARPMSTGELLGPDGPDRQMGRLTNIDEIKALKSASLMRPCFIDDANGCISAEQPVPAPAAGGFPMVWTAGSIPITSLWVSGAVNGRLFNEDPDAVPDFKSWVSFVDNTSSGSNPTTRPTIRWDDQRIVNSSSTATQVMCSRQSNSDEHCAAGVPIDGFGGYNPYTFMTYSELWGKDDEQRTLMRSYNWFRPIVAE